ncbi:MAG: hypothetical protein EOP91_00085 [Lysobacteraceae bacterium]|nr:MAG: hypothetical protein EOP91_00085 [Xanthomonadaceae bacterium]
MTPKYSIAIIGIYFGKLPDYFDLWLASCGCNKNYEWLVFTDADCSGYEVPFNVHVHALSLAEFSRIASDALSLNIDIDTPYKVCDLRPAYWMLLPISGRTYDFWGHCDLDMVFGRLDGFITDEILENNDKIFSVGHLTLYRNSDEANLMFKRPHEALDWKEIMSDPKHRGFDEHIGVNRIWALHGGRVFENEAIIADLDPHVRRMELLDPAMNRREQIFYVDNGRVYQGYFGSDGAWVANEFMYAHFQKRKMARRDCPPYATSYVLAKDGFCALPAIPPTREFIASRNGFRIKDYFLEFRYRARRFARFSLNKAGK